MQAIRGQDVGADVGADAFDQWGQHPNALAAPVEQGRSRDVCANRGEDLVLAIEKTVVIKLRHQDMCKKARPNHAAWNRARRCRQLGDLFTAAAGLLQAGGLDQLKLGRDQLEYLADVLTDQAQGPFQSMSTITNSIFVTGSRTSPKSDRATMRDRVDGVRPSSAMNRPISSSCLFDTESQGNCWT